MGTALASGEDSIVNALFEVRSGRVVLLEEDETGARTTESLVGGSSDNITVLERVVQLLRSNET